MCTLFQPSHPISSLYLECSMCVNIFTHIPPIVWKSSCKAQASYFFPPCLFSKGKEALPGWLCRQSLQWVYDASPHYKLVSRFSALGSKTVHEKYLLFQFSLLFPKHCLGCRSGPPIEFRFFWELGEPKSGLHQRHQCLCWAAHKAAFTQTA